VFEGLLSVREGLLPMLEWCAVPVVPGRRIGEGTRAWCISGVSARGLVTSGVRIGRRPAVTA